MTIDKTMVSWAVGTAVGVFAVMTGVYTYWPRLGWITPNAHAAAVADVRAGVANTAAFSAALEQRLAGQIKEAADSLGEQLKESQDEYRCDKLRAELVNLRRQLRSAQDDLDLAEEIRRVEMRMGPNGLDCARFDV